MEKDKGLNRGDDPTCTELAGDLAVPEDLIATRNAQAVVVAANLRAMLKNAGVEFSAGSPQA